MSDKEAIQLLQHRLDELLFLPSQIDYSGRINECSHLILSKKTATRAAKAIHDTLVSGQYRILDLLNATILPARKSNRRVYELNDEHVLKYMSLLRYAFRIQCLWYVKFNDYEAEINRLCLESDVEICVYACLTFNPNGYIREAALDWLAKKRSKWFLVRKTTEVDLVNLPLLLIRLNDWVPKIKNKAYEHIKNILDIAPSQSLLSCIVIIDWLQSSSRYDHASLLATITLKLNQDCFDGLINNIAHANYKVARASLNLIMKNKQTVGRIIAAARKCSDPKIRLSALTMAKQHLSKDEIYPILLEWRNDSFFSIRRNTVISLAELFPKKTIEHLKMFLTDVNTRVRTTARFYLKKHGFDGFTQYYTNNIKKGLNLVSSIHGLAETGDIEHFSIIKPFISSKVTKIKLAVIYAIFQLEPIDKSDLILAQLPTRNNKILKTISEEIKKNPTGMDLLKIHPLFFYYKDHPSVGVFFKNQIALVKGLLNKIQFAIEFLIQYHDTPKLCAIAEQSIQYQLVAIEWKMLYLYAATRNSELIPTILNKAEQAARLTGNECIYRQLKKNLTSFAGGDQSGMSIHRDPPYDFNTMKLRRWWAS